MEFAQLLRRAFLVSFVVAVGGAIGVYSLHYWFHTVFVPAPIADAVGTFVIVMVAFVMQRMVSLIFYRDHMLGLAKVVAVESDKAGRFHDVAEEVSGELKQVHEFQRGRARPVEGGDRADRESGVWHRRALADDR